MANAFRHLQYHWMWLLEQLFVSLDGTSLFERRTRLHQKLVKLEQGQSQQNDFRQVKIIDSKYLSQLDLNRLPKNEPILFRGLAQNARCMSHWSWSFFEKEYGSVPQPMGLPKEKTFSIIDRPLSEILTDLKKESHQLALYSGNLVQKSPQLVQDLDEDLWLHFDFLRSKINVSRQMFLSGKGLHTKFHCELGNIFSVGIFGTKRWTIYPPKFSYLFNPKVTRNMFIRSDDFPTRAAIESSQLPVNGWEVLVGPGDVLYCPSFYWHFVETIESSLSVAIKWSEFGILLRHPFLATILLTARNPSILKRLIPGLKSSEFSPPSV